MNANKATIKDVTVSTKVVNQLKNTQIKVKFNKLDGDQWYIALEEGLNVAYTMMKDMATITGIPKDLLKVEALCDCVST